MNIRQLVSKLEEIERLIDGKAKDLCWDLIEELIEIDMEMENKIKSLTPESNVYIKRSDTFF